MDTIKLGPEGRTTTRLGFGGSSTMGILSRRQSLMLLEDAFEAGIRHFDTAPLYGYGEAEACLGEFLKRHKGLVTVATKFGIPAPRKHPLLSAAKMIAAPLLQAAPGLKRLVTSAVRSKGRQQVEAVKVAPQPNPIFTAERARQSLENSLTALGTDYIDLWLLHEVHAIDLASDPHHDGLLRFMEDAVRDGKVGLFGIGSSREHVPELVRQHPRYCRAIQQEWSALDPVDPPTDYFHLYYRALSEQFNTLVTALKQDAVLCRRWSSEVGLDLSKPSVLARLMLKASYVLNGSSLLLFSSKKEANIAANVATASDPTLDAPALKLYQILQEERLQHSI